MSSSEPEQEDAEANSSSSERDAEMASSSPRQAPSDASKVSAEWLEIEGSNSNQQLGEYTVKETTNPSKNDLIRKLLVKVDKDFSDICSDDIIFKKAVESYLYRVIDCVCLGIIFSIYREVKMGTYTAAVVSFQQLAEKKSSNELRTDIFAEYYDKECKCVCSKCTRTVLASGFAVHLEICMGLKQSRTRNARRTVTATNSRKPDSLAESMPSSDDDNDADWNGEKRKKKRDRNGTKRIKGTLSKKTEIEPTEVTEVEVDVEGEPEERTFEEEEANHDIFSLSEFFLDESSQSHATGSSTGYRSNTSNDEAESKVERIVHSCSPTLSS